MNIHEKSRYHEVYAHAQRDPEGFWAEAAKEIDWIEPPRKIFDAAEGVYGRWFPGARRQHMLQRAGSPCRGRARQSGGADPQLAGDQQRLHFHLRPDA